MHTNRLESHEHALCILHVDSLMQAQHVSFAYAHMQDVPANKTHLEGEISWDSMDLKQQLKRPTAPACRHVEGGTRHHVPLLIPSYQRPLVQALINRAVVQGYSHMIWRNVSAVI